MSELALKHLETGEMIAVTGAWLGAERTMFESIAEVKPLLPQVEEVHGNLVRAQPAATGTDPAVQAISEAQAPVDDRHDHVYRTLYYAFESQSELLLSQEPPDDEGAAEVLRVRDLLLPDGLRGTRASYQSEAGNAERAIKLVREDAKVGHALAKIQVTKKVDGVTLVGDLAKAGARLGELERKKQALTPQKVEVRMRDARNDWIDLVQTVLKVLARAKSSPKAVAAIRSGVVTAAETVAKRDRTRNRRNAPPPAPAPIADAS